MTKKEQQKHKDFIMIPIKMLKMDINARSILLYGLILKMSYGMTEETYATNKTFSKYIGKSERQVIRCLEELKENNCIQIRKDEENPNIRYIKPLILNEVKYIAEKDSPEDWEYNEKEDYWINKKTGFKELTKPKILQ